MRKTTLPVAVLLALVAPFAVFAVMPASVPTENPIRSETEQARSRAGRDLRQLDGESGSKAGYGEAMVKIEAAIAPVLGQIA